MSRAERWWRPAPPRNVRPAVRSARRARHVAGQDRTDDAFAAGYAAGLERTRKRDEDLRRLVDAADAAEQGDPSLLDRFVDGDPPADDDLLDVADAAGVTPLPEVDGDQLAADVERWLRDREGDG